MKICYTTKFILLISTGKTHYSTSGPGTIGYPNAKGRKKKEGREGRRKEKLDAFVFGNSEN